MGKELQEFLFALIVCFMWLTMPVATHNDQWAYGLICMVLGAGTFVIYKKWGPNG